MSNLASNPWSFAPSDVNVATVSTIASNSDGTVTLTTTAAATFVAGQSLTIIGVTNPIYNGFYFLLTATSTTVYQLVPQPFVPNRIPPGTASSASGTAILNQYNSAVRIEDLSWQNVTTATQTLDVRDRNGNIIWQAAIGATAPTSASQNRGKLMWVWGISINVMSTGLLLVTIN